MTLMHMDLLAYSRLRLQNRHQIKTITLLVHIPFKNKLASTNYSNGNIEQTNSKPGSKIILMGADSWLKIVEKRIKKHSR